MNFGVLRGCVASYTALVDRTGSIFGVVMIKTDEDTFNERGALTVQTNRIRVCLHEPLWSAVKSVIEPGDPCVAVYHVSPKLTTLVADAFMAKERAFHLGRGDNGSTVRDGMPPGFERWGEGGWDLE